MDEGQLIQDLKSNDHSKAFSSLYASSLAHSPRSTTGPGGGGGGGAVSKSSIPSTLPFLSQIAEEDLTSASTSVTSFHLPNSIARRNHPNPLPPTRTLSDHELFVRVNDESNKSHPLGQDFSSSNTGTKPTSYAHFNFDQSSKQLVKGNSTISISSDSVDVPLNNIDLGITNTNGTAASRRKGQTNSPPDEPAIDSLAKTTAATGKPYLRKQTQDIAARAAQRRATRHHKELMEDMGEECYSSEARASRLFLGC